MTTGHSSLSEQNLAISAARSPFESHQLTKRAGLEANMSMLEGHDIHRGRNLSPTSTSRNSSTSKRSREGGHELQRAPKRTFRRLSLRNKTLSPEMITDSQVESPQDDSTEYSISSQTDASFNPLEDASPQGSGQDKPAGQRQSPGGGPRLLFIPATSRVSRGRTRPKNL